MILLKKVEYNAKIKNIQDKIPDITNVAINTTLNGNAKINEVKNEIPSITNLATTTAFTGIENKKLDHSKSIITSKFTAETVAARLAEAKLASKKDIPNFIKKTDFDDEMKNLNKIITSNKTKHMLVEK